MQGIQGNVKGTSDTRVAESISFGFDRLDLQPSQNRINAHLVLFYNRFTRQRRNVYDMRLATFRNETEYGFGTPRPMLMRIVLKLLPKAQGRFSSPTLFRRKIPSVYDRLYHSNKPIRKIIWPDGSTDSYYNNHNHELNNFIRIFNYNKNVNRQRRKQLHCVIYSFLQCVISTV